MCCDCHFYSRTCVSSCGCIYLLAATHHVAVRVVADHGYNLGQHRLPSCKLNVYDHDIRIPMVIRGPGIKADQTFEFIGSNVSAPLPSFVRPVWTANH